MLIERIETDDREARRGVLAAIERYNAAQLAEDPPGMPFSVLIRDDDGVAIGGASGVSYWEWLFVDLLYLPEALRGGGLGTRLLRTAERIAAERGLRGVWLDTLSNAAAAFYRKQGFAEFARIPDFVAGQAKYWFAKSPPSAWPDQGLVVGGAPTEAERATLNDGIMQFNTALLGPTARHAFGLVLREGPGAPIEGGLWSRVLRGWMFVELLVLPEHARRQRLGSRLMDMAEAEAHARGCQGVWLDTFSFQARPFYEKRGFAVLGAIDDFPAPHRRFFLAKRLDRK